MGKRSNFERKERDFYRTPLSAVEVLIPHIRHIKNYVEPCAGDGALAEHLGRFGKYYAYLSDICPQDSTKPIHKMNVFDITSCNAQAFITNPPWDRRILHPLILHLSNLAPTYLLFDSDWAHTIQSEPYMSRCHTIISVGRCKWIEDSPHTGKDNCSWYHFERKEPEFTRFYGKKRVPKEDTPLLL